MARKMTLLDRRAMRAPGGTGCFELCPRDECSVLDSFTAPCPLYPGLKAPACRVQYLLRVLLTRRTLREKGML